MNIIISNDSTEPIYEQITSAIKKLILTDELKVGDALPSIRQLAKDLRISVITTKRAYEELEQEGYIETIPSKGSYVALKNQELRQEERLKQVEAILQKAIHEAYFCHISKSDFDSLVTYLWEEETK